MTLNKRLTILSLTAALLLPTAAYSATYAYNKLSAALIYRIGLYVTWQLPVPKTTYCFVGNQGKEIASIFSKEIDAKKLSQTINILSGKPLSAYTVGDCQILYVGSDADFNQETIKQLSYSALTISDHKSHLLNGFIASLELRNDKPNVTLSQSNLKSSTITLDSRLLANFNLVK